MRELVGDADEQDDEPGQNEGLNSVQAEDVLPDFMPVQEGSAERDGDEGGRGDEEGPSEEEPHLANEAVEEAIGVERLQPQ